MSTKGLERALLRAALGGPREDESWRWAPVLVGSMSEGVERTPAGREIRWSLNWALAAEVRLARTTEGGAP